MSGFGATKFAAPGAQRDRMLALIGGLLGLLMFIWGFLKWIRLEDNGQKQSYAGYAFGMPTTAVIGLSIAAGLVAVLGALDPREGRGVPSAIPLGLAGASLLLVIGVFTGKSSISDFGGTKVSADVGLVLGLITAVLQTAALGWEWIERLLPRTSATPGGPAAYPGQQGGFGPPSSGGYAPPTAGYAQPPAGYTAPSQPSAPQQDQWGRPAESEGYGRPQQFGAPAYPPPEPTPNYPAAQPTTQMPRLDQPGGEPPAGYGNTPGQAPPGYSGPTEGRPGSDEPWDEGERPRT